MFSVMWEHRNIGESGRKGSIRYATKFVCKIETWAFNSCACFALSKFNDGYHSFDPTTIEEFFEFLRGLDEDWQPCEFYFLLSKSQLKLPKLKPLYKHPNVKLRDVFINKSHGPNKVYLFRYSDKKDFKRLQLPKGV